MVPANCAIVDDNVPGPHAHTVPFFRFEAAGSRVICWLLGLGRIHWAVQGSGRCTGECRRTVNKLSGPFRVCSIWLSSLWWLAVWRMSDHLTGDQELVVCAYVASMLLVRNAKLVICYLFVCNAVVMLAK